MNKEEFEKKLLELAACELSPEEWTSWWAEHEAFIEGFVSRGDYLRLKPRGSSWGMVTGSQKGALEYLVFTASLRYADIPYTQSNKYQKNYEKELADFFKQERVKAKDKLAALKLQHPQLFAAWPRFGNSLKNCLCEGDEIASGASEAELATLPYALPADIKAFFGIVSKIALDGIRIDLADVRPETLCGMEYLVLGEFWKEADGDLLLIKPDETATPTPIHYYFHEMNTVKKLCNSIDDLMEKQFSRYNNVHAGDL